MKAKTTAHKNIYRDTVYDNSPTRLRELSSTKYIPLYYIYALSLTFSSDQKAQKKKVHVYILCLCTHSYRQCWYKYYSCTVNVVIYNVCTKYLQFYLKCKYVQDSAITTLYEVNVVLQNINKSQKLLIHVLYMLYSCCIILDSLWSFFMRN